MRSVALVLLLAGILLAGCSSAPVGPGLPGETPAAAAAVSTPRQPVDYKLHIVAPDPDAATLGECSVALLLSIPSAVAPTPTSGPYGGIFPVPDGFAGGTFTLQPSADLTVRWEDGKGGYVGGVQAAGSIPKGAHQVDVCGTGPAAANVDVTLALVAP